jgi:Transcription factor TFIIH complex subunit Tfb5
MSSKGKRKPGVGRGKAAAAAAKGAPSSSSSIGGTPPVPAFATNNGSKKKSSSLSATAAVLGKNKSAAGGGATGTGGGGGSGSSDLPEATYLITCDIPTKQYIQYLNEIKSVDKKFIVEELDETHLLVSLTARSEIEQKIDAWMDDNVFSAVEKVGEDLDIS